MGIKPLSWTLVVAILAVMSCGCTTRDISRNIYEGARANEASHRDTPREHSTMPTPSYDQYERERQIGR